MYNVYMSLVTVNNVEANNFSFDISKCVCIVNKLSLSLFASLPSFPPLSLSLPPSLPHFPLPPSLSPFSLCFPHCPLQTHTMLCQLLYYHLMLQQFVWSAVSDIIHPLLVAMQYSTLSTTQGEEYHTTR